jgi:uncharacterized membrane protein (DUF106 family)
MDEIIFWNWLSLSESQRSWACSIWQKLIRKPSVIEEKNMLFWNWKDDSFTWGTPETVRWSLFWYFQSMQKCRKKSSFTIDDDKSSIIIEFIESFWAK